MTVAFSLRQIAMAVANRESARDGGITVVMPTYNHAHYISEALDSLFAQTRLPDRILVLDDASTDATADAVRPFLIRTPSIDYIRFDENRGVVQMLNVGLDKVATEFAVFLAADDTLDPTALQKSIEILRAHPRAPICGLYARYIDRAGHPLPTPAGVDFGTKPRYVPPGECLRHLVRDGALFGGNGAMYRTASLREHGGFSPELLSFCDGFRIQDLALSGGICIVPEVLASWRRSGDSYAATTLADPQSALAILRAIEVQLKERPYFPPAYASRLLRRWQFTAALAGIECAPPDKRAVREALRSRSTLVRAFAAAATEVLGRSALVALLALYLRPFDIVRAFRRRLAH
ncbi:MAG TPA: glycosyltransferase family A protein [Stellaceae bacterium]|nr:glycosyltransferase family A protein [Stellaceae bacterium]